MNTSSNIQSFKDDVFSEARELGRDAARGGDALPLLAARALKAADDGVLNLDKHPKGSKFADDAEEFYTNYSEAYGKKAVYEHTLKGFKAQVSKLRQIMRVAIEAGSRYDAIAGFDQLKERRERAKEADEAVKGMYPCIVDFARAQLKLDRQITADELDEIVKKPESEPKPVDEVLAKMRASLEKIITGEHNSGKCDDARVVAAHDQLRDYLAGIEEREAEEENAQQVAAYMQKHGLKLVPSGDVVPDPEPVSELIAAE